MDELHSLILKIGLTDLTRLDKAVLIAAALKRTGSDLAPSIKTICDAFEAAHLARPNSTVLKRALISDRRVSVRNNQIRALGGADKFLDQKFPATGIVHDPVQERLSPDTRQRIALTPGITSAYIDELEKMLELYASLHALENSMRLLITAVLSKKYGADWWDVCASSPQKRKHADREAKERDRKWLPARSSIGPLYSLDWSDLISMMRKHEEEFLPHIGEVDFLHRFADLGLIRHVVAHHGFVAEQSDYDRVRLAHYDWVRQVTHIPPE